MSHDNYDDAFIRGILDKVKTVAVVGASQGDDKPSMFVVKYLSERGYRVFPINPGRAGQLVAGVMAYARLADVPEPIDMVDVFRRADAVPGVLDEVLALSPLPKIFWMQLGVRNDEAAARAEATGMTVVMNRCPKIEYGRLSREIGWVGVNTRTLSSKKPRRLGGGVQRLQLGPGVRKPR
ncbi:MAG TPA: CoA-binding protein [Xanthobacteraceae bacterium]|nr:CoA-binding protein [Xanthobacteraceae bacterium]